MVKDDCDKPPCKALIAGWRTFAGHDGRVCSLIIPSIIADADHWSSSWLTFRVNIFCGFDRFAPVFILAITVDEGPVLLVAHCIQILHLMNEYLRRPPRREGYTWSMNIGVGMKK